MRRQGMIVTLNQLHKLIEELEEEFEWKENVRVTDDDRKFQINIINKTPECSDTWEIENFDEFAKRGYYEK
jgi:chromosome condensin MukBEF MukE localization factor